MFSKEVKKIIAEKRGGVNESYLTLSSAGGMYTFTMLEPTDFFNLEDYAQAALFKDVKDVWEVFAKLDDYLAEFFKNKQGQNLIWGNVRPGAILVGDKIYIGPGAKIEPTAYIEGPVIIGPGTMVGPGAYIRGGTITGNNCVIGHGTEAVKTIMLDRAAAPHFNYVGHSILGNDTNIGAGGVLANSRLDGAEIGGTGLKKFGAVLGDRVKIGCNAVTEPGTFLLPDTWVMPCASIRRGWYKPGQRRTDLEKIN